MTLSLRATKGKAVFEFEEDGMKASWELLATDSGPELVGKLDRLLSFLRREKLTAGLNGQIGALGGLQGQPVTPVMPLWERSNAPEAAALLPAWPKPPQFTGVPPVQPPPLADSLAQASASGWELYDESNRDD